MSCNCSSSLIKYITSFIASNNCVDTNWLNVCSTCYNNPKAIFEIINIAYPYLTLSVYDKYSEDSKFSLFLHVEDDKKTIMLYKKAYGEEDPLVENVKVYILEE